MEDGGPPRPEVRAFRAEEPMNLQKYISGFFGSYHNSESSEDISLDNGDETSSAEMRPLLKRYLASIVEGVIREKLIESFICDRSHNIDLHDVSVEFSETDGTSLIITLPKEVKAKLFKVLRTSELKVLVKLI